MERVKGPGDTGVLGRRVLSEEVVQHIINPNARVKVSMGGWVTRYLDPVHGREKVEVWLDDHTWVSRFLDELRSDPVWEERG